jgi:hypothetical protein
VWSERAVQFYESPEVLDTNAHLAYQLGNKTRAIEILEKIIPLRQQRGYPTSAYEAALERMRKDLPLEK